MEYKRNIEFLISDGLVEPMVIADRLTRQLNELPLERIAEQADIIKDLFGAVGSNPNIEHNFHCNFGRNIFVGDNFFAGFNCTMLDYADITIGDNCLIGPNVGIYTTFHSIAPEGRHENGFAEPIAIGNNVWIGGGSTILAGVTIGNNVVIGAGSVVNKNIPDNEMWAGNPARKIKNVK